MRWQLPGYVINSTKIGSSKREGTPSCILWPNGSCSHADLQAKLQAADTLARLEDIYLPFRPKRKTRATAAKERGLEPLAKRIFAQDHSGLDPEKEALSFVDAEKGVASAKEALAGARDIMAEWMSEDAEARLRMRALYQSQGVTPVCGSCRKRRIV